MNNQLFKRKFLFSLMAVVMCLGFAAMSYGAATVSVDPATMDSPAVGEQFTVNINIAGGKGVAGFQATVNYDSTAISYVSAAKGDYIPGDPAAGTFFPILRPGDSNVVIGGTSIGAGAGDGDGTLATVTFQVVEVKASSISLSDVTISDAAANPLEVTSANGMVTVPAPDPEPTPDPEPMPDPEPVVPEPQVFKITLTNLTVGEPGMGGQIFSPPIFATHVAGVKIYEVGQPANAALVALAEGGDVSGLVVLAAAAGANSVVGEGMVLPGASVTIMITADAMNSALSLATMLVSTNDAFIGVADLALYDEAGMPVTVTRELRSYDAGSEQNTERGTDIPGPVGLPPEEDPMGSNARVPTEGGVITPHPGIMGVGDVAASFAWTEPTAMLTVEPYVPEPDPEPEPVLPTYDVKLASGLNMISVPLMPTEPYTAQSLADMLGSTVVIKLDGYSQSFVGYVAGVEGGYDFAIEGGKGYIVNTPEAKMVTFSGTAWSNAPAEMESEEAAMDEAAAAPKINTAQSAWAFVITSDLQGQESGASYTMIAKNLRTGVVTTEKVTEDNGRVTGVWADLNRKSVIEAGDKVEISLVDENGTVVSGPFEHTVQTSDINNAFLNVNMRVGDVRPKDTILGQNFPNPFNPETWIPYQLSRDSNVTIDIHGTSGSLVRTLDLGHKSIGAYMTSSSAAYWDGKNSAGESVASGIYFYTLKTDDFSTTRKMVILK
ncbi:T9SS type A sorting domain-containing protein [Candidatus Poribacteria bacterium]|nr:T9SS type A sorting domain-containing protein [Candidatus Poribacteria bacterium]